MRRSMLAICALLAVTTAGCDQLNKVKGLFSKKAPPAAPPQHPATPPAPPTSAPTGAAKPGQSARPGQTAETSQTAPAPGGAVTPVQDKPYSSPDTGTVAPGMSESQVYSLWGAPVGTRHVGTRTYLYFENGCERSCGTADIVTLDNGQVTDAIVRWPGHGYSGQSSSPRSGPPSRKRPGAGTLTMPDTTRHDTTTTAPAATPAPAPAPAPVPADTVKPKTDSLKPTPDSSVKPDSLKPKPDSSKN